MLSARHPVKAILEAVYIDNEDPGKRMYLLLLEDPGFITSDVFEESYIRIGVKLQKVMGEGRPHLLIDVVSFTE